MADLTIKPTSSPANVQRTARTGGKEVSRDASSPSGTPSDTVELTSLSTALAKESGANATPINTERVEAIKQAIREGRFKVNPEAVADKLISTVQELVKNRA